MMMIVVLQDVHVFFSLRVYVLPFPLSFFAVQWHVVLSQPAFSPSLVSPLPIQCLFLIQLLHPTLWRIHHSMFLAQANNKNKNSIKTYSTFTQYFQKKSICIHTKRFHLV